MYRITAGVDGMMCGMCETHMQDAVRKNFKIKSVSASHKERNVVIISSEEITKEAIKEVIEALGYDMLSYKCEKEEKKKLFGIFG